MVNQFQASKAVDIRRIELPSFPFKEGILFRKCHNQLSYLLLIQWHFLLFCFALPIQNVQSQVAVDQQSSGYRLTHRLLAEWGWGAESHSKKASCQSKNVRKKELRIEREFDRISSSGLIRFLKLDSGLRKPFISLVRPVVPLANAFTRPVPLEIGG